MECLGIFIKGTDAFVSKFCAVIWWQKLSTLSHVCGWKLQWIQGHGFFFETCLDFNLWLFLSKCSVWSLVILVPAVKWKSFARLYEYKHKAPLCPNIFLWCDPDENNQHLTSDAQDCLVFICQVVLILLCLWIGWLTVIECFIIYVLWKRNLVCCVKIFCFWFVWKLTWSIKFWWHDKICEWLSEWRWIIGWIIARNWMWVKSEDNNQRALWRWHNCFICNPVTVLAATLCSALIAIG
jgi:hypothetical protein